MADPSLFSVVATGLLLGWSVAWPPGPINAEIVRRGLSRGFAPAIAVGLGACTGDFAWALGIALGAGRIAERPGVRPALAAISLALLLFLAATFLSAAARSWRRTRAGLPLEVPRRLDGSRGGFLLGLAMALSSPWNIAFWLAVIGQQAGAELELGRSLLLAGSVVAAAALWTLFLATATRLGARFATPAWDVGTRAATGILMLYFAVRAVLRLAAS